MKFQKWELVSAALGMKPSRLDLKTFAFITNFVFNLQKDGGKSEVRYCKGQVYCGNMEFSFEQLRAAAWMRKHGPIIDPRSDDNCTKRFTQDMEETAVVRTDIDANCNSDNVVDDVANKDADFTVVNTDEMVRPQLPVNLMEEK